MSLFNLVHRIKPTNIRTITKLFATHTTGTPIDVNAPSKKAKTIPIPRITLLSGEDVSVSTLPEAQKLAKRRDLKLVKILDLDTKTQRPIYKLMTGSEYHAEDLKQREERKKTKLSSTTLKGEKVLIINSNISEHDLKIHGSKIAKWIAKRYEVKVMINGDANNMDKAESVYKAIESTLGETGGARILQKRQKGTEIKFQLVPPKKDMSIDGSQGRNPPDS